MIKERKT